MASKKPKMTLAQFLKKLGTLKKKNWFLDHGYLRCLDGQKYWCPILAVGRAAGVAGKMLNCNYDDVAKALGMTQGDADRILCAADGPGPRDIQLQKAMLKVLGLTHLATHPR